jgi:hypothetical protein
MVALHWDAADMKRGVPGTVGGVRFHHKGALVTPTSSFCVRYAADPTRALFYQSDDCTPKWGWGSEDRNVGVGGLLQAYTTPLPGTVQYCYR